MLPGDLSSSAFKVKNADAAARLRALLEPALDELRRLGDEPILIAECPDKFNDAFTDDYWYAAQVGDASWFQSHFYESGSYPPRVEERRAFGRWRPLDPDAPAREAAAERLATARRILHGLKKSGWRELAVEAFTDRYPILCLGWQYGQAWFSLSSAVEGEGFAWALTADGGYAMVGMCDRMDQGIGGPCPIWFRNLDADAVRLLTPEAQRQFVLRPQDPHAYARLCALLSDAAAAAAAVEASQVVLLSAGSATNMYISASPGSPALISVEGCEMPLLNEDGSVPPNSFYSVYDAYRDHLQLLSPVLRRLEDADWRAVFGRAFGVPFGQFQMLALFVEDGNAALVKDNSVLSVKHGELVFAGLCDFTGINESLPAPIMPKGV